MKGVTREPTGREKEVQEELDKLLGGDSKRYVVVDREEKEKDSQIGVYRLYGNVSDEEGVIVHLLNFIDGLLETDHFAHFAAIVSRRAVERMGVNMEDIFGSGRPKPKAN